MNTRYVVDKKESIMIGDNYDIEAASNLELRILFTKIRAAYEKD